MRNFRQIERGFKIDPLAHCCIAGIDRLRVFPAKVLAKNPQGRRGYLLIDDVLDSLRFR
jgi:hypothetical protein